MLSYERVCMGTRCTIQDYQVAVWGKRASDGFANSGRSSADPCYLVFKPS